MFLPSARGVEFEVHCDDDRRSHPGSTRSRHGLQSVICWFCRLKLSRFTLKVCWDLHSLRFPPWSGFSEFVVSPWQFCCTICYWEFEFITFFVLSILLSRWFFEDKFLMHPTFPNLLNPQSEDLLSKFSPRSTHTQEGSRVILSCTIMNSWLISRRNGMIFKHCSKRNY